eukprot:969873-Prorocentrum_lima.AAC.1
MTSSLVGSEMCIRDRQVGANIGRTWKGNAPRKSPEYSELWSNRSVESENCLLYTSDAADDM